MKQSKIVTPVLLFLVIILLLIAVYFNFVYKPLETSTSELSMKNELAKNQRMEIELSMINEDAIKKDIETTKTMILEDSELILIHCDDLAEDINVNAKKAGINLQDIIISHPEYTQDKDTVSDSETLLSIPADIFFDTTYDKAMQFIASFEDSKTGAYLVEFLEVTEDEEKKLNWKLSLSLYYYGDPQTVPIIVEGAQETDIGTNNWTQ